jgi:type III secretory pathway component EscS
MSVQFYEEHNTAFLAVKHVTIAAALVNYIVSDPLQPTTHLQDSAFMRFCALRLHFMHLAHWSARKIREYRAADNNRPSNSISFMPAVATTSGRLHCELVRILFLGSSGDRPLFCSFRS